MRPEACGCRTRILLRGSVLVQPSSASRVVGDSFVLCLLWIS